MGSEQGRPRGFDAELALDRALGVFWRYGYQGASFTQLTSAMGVSKPSIYAAFGDKEALYLRALQRYAEVWVKRHALILEREPDGRRAVERYMRSVAHMQTNPGLPGGCFIINGSADCDGLSAPATVEQALRDALLEGEARLARRLLRAQREGQLAPDICIDNLAALFGSLLAGLGVLAKSGAQPAKLDAVISTAMAVWPSPAPAKAP